MTDQPTAWILPPGWTSEPHQRIGHCRSCDAPVLWYTSVKSGKRSPFNADGTSHFANCPQAESWRRKAPDLRRDPEETPPKTHLVYPEGPECSPSCPGDWSTWHDGYSAGYEDGMEAGRA